MNVHNLMEDVVSRVVNDMYDQLKADGAAWLTCDCENCRIDTISYVLNKVPAKYIVSGRGLTHSSEILNDSQTKADVEALAFKGIQIVSGSKRPFHLEDNPAAADGMSESPGFNFPAFTGIVMDGGSFEPVPDVKLLLKHNGKVVEMMDKSWSNPTTTAKSTNGIYSFWPKPFPAEKAGIAQKFNFSLEATAEGYAPVHYHFEIPMISEDSSRAALNSTVSFKLKDIVIFKDFMINPME